MNAEAAANKLADEVKEANEHLQTLLDQRRELDAKADALTQAERRVKEARGEIAKGEARLAERREKIVHFDALLARAEEIEGAMAKLEQARQEKEQWDELLQKSLQLQTRASDLQGTIQQARSVLEGDLKSVETSIKTHQQTLERFSKRERELSEAQKQVELLERLQQDREAHQRLLVQWTEADAKLRAENETLKKAMHDLRERMELLEHSETAECPVCRRPLSAEGRVQALEEAQQEGNSMGNRYRENQQEMKHTANEIATLKDKIGSAERQLNELGRWQRRAAEAAQAAAEMRLARQALQAADQQAAELRARLEAGDYAREAQAQLAELAEASASLGYDREKHDAAKRTIQQLAPRQQEYNELVAARQQRASIVEIVQTLEQNRRHWQEKVVQAEEEIAALAAQLREREAVLRRVQEQRVRLNNLQSEVINAQRYLGGARQKLHYAEQQAATQPKVEEGYHAAVEERTIYEQLANAFGKRGVQAMIIESSIPEIEVTANELLGRMSDGRMSVALHTQRESKSTDSTIETLDIIISDENGERPYETFSGGEAFRVNFALRIALSKLLAHRAGTSLRTLVIDEGFGSQDAHGRDRLVEAITSVQNDFARVIVITHIDELKDAFPVRIDVVKGANGSRVIVN